MINPLTHFSSNRDPDHNHDPLQKNTELAQAHATQIDNLQTSTSAMKQEYEDLLLESEEQFKQQDAQYEAERNRVKQLSHEIEQINAHSARQEELRKMEMRLLEDSVAAAKEQIGIQEREKGLKGDALKNAKGRIQELESNVKLLEDCSRQSELDAAAVVQELNLKLDQGTVARAKLEEERDSIVAESKKIMDQLQDKISSLESEFMELKSEIVSKDSQLEQRQTTVDSLLTMKEEMEQKILSYRKDLETLMVAYDETKAEYSQQVTALKTINDKESKVLKSEYDDLRNLVTETQDELERFVSKNDQMQKSITERNKTIDELMSLKRSLEAEKEEAELLLSDVQERWQNHLKENEEMKRRNTQMRIEKEKEINAHMDALQYEREDKEALERKIKQVEAKLEDTKKQVKSTVELKAENYLLQDKIDRQEAFLKRKIHKEKVMKERMVPVSAPGPGIGSSSISTNGSHSSLKSPSRIKSRINSRRPTSVSVSTPSTSSMSQRVSSLPQLTTRQRTTSSFDLRPRPCLDRSIDLQISSLELQRSASDELDELLNDGAEV